MTGLTTDAHRPLPQGGQLRNALTVDVESFVDSNLQSFSIPSCYISERQQRLELEKNMETLLNILATERVRATFFIVGSVADLVPKAVTQLSDAGHEVGCHSFVHIRIFDQSRDDFRNGLLSAKHKLEDLAGVNVYGFRAPDFSITARSQWALDILSEAGFSYDSSIYPFAWHDVYGMAEASPWIYRLPNGLVEFPLSTTTVLGRKLPFGGGGYFRLYPVAMTRFLIKRQNKAGHPAMFYIHPYEAGPEIPAIPGLSFVRRFRHYHNCNNGSERLIRLLRSCSFAPAADILRERNYL